MISCESWCAWCLVALLAVTAAACASGETNQGQPADAARAADNSGARTLPIPGNDLPSDHPPLETTGGAPGMIWKAPEHWVEEEPSNSMRVAQYRVAGETGDGECVVFYFGAGQGGDPMSNAQRWAGQFSQPDGRPSNEVMQVTELESAKVPLYVVEVTGTYSGGMSDIEERAGYMLLGGIARGGDAPWFFKFVGPEATVRAERDAFLQMMESVGGDG